jgi:wobble nucleotide-excising tRNase
MLRKIVSIKNVGRFRNSAAAGNPQLAKHTFIVGANGFGKTTICAILRSLHAGDPSHVLGRLTLGVTDTAAIELLLDTGLARFDGAAWTATHPAAIFDGVFVAENIHSGDVVDIDHKRNLYRVIIGDDGVRLAEEDARLAGESRTKTLEITAAAKATQPHIPAGMKLDAFAALSADADIDAKIAEQQRTIEAIKQAEVITARSVLSEIHLPSFPADDFAYLLARSIDDIAQDAERRLADHLAAHGMAADGGNWIAAGLALDVKLCRATVMAGLPSGGDCSLPERGSKYSPAIF